MQFFCAFYSYIGYIETAKGDSAAIFLQWHKSSSMLKQHFRIIEVRPQHSLASIVNIDSDCVFQNKYQ